jgi:hypothetical protein
MSHALFFVYLGNIVTTSTEYSESGTMGSGKKIENKTIPIGMNVNFIIPFFQFLCFAFCYMFYMCVCVYGIFFIAFLL